jgi:DNA polymerase-4
MEDRKIIHIDMDAFYASVEQQDRPELKGKPVAVGGSTHRGVVAAASYEARKFGIRSAMPAVQAARLCPGLIFVKPNFARYKAISQQIRSIFHVYTDLVEPLSLDEAYLDVSKNKIGLDSATRIAQKIKEDIKTETSLTASAGVSYNKFLAKTASDLDKPDGLYVILPEEGPDFVARLPVHKFHGIGKVTADKMVRAGIFTGKDLRHKSLDDLVLRFGKAGHYYYQISRGIDYRPVQPSRESKSVSAERTFEKNIYNHEEALETLAAIAGYTFERYERMEKKGYTVTLKVKYADFRQITRSKTMEETFQSKDQIYQAAAELLTEDLITTDGIRLMGVGISNFTPPVAPESATQMTIAF